LLSNDSYTVKEQKQEQSLQFFLACAIFLKPMMQPTSNASDSRTLEDARFLQMQIQKTDQFIVDLAGLRLG
jgi:hypothetical protein